MRFPEGAAVGLLDIADDDEVPDADADADVDMEMGVSVDGLVDKPYISDEQPLSV